MADSILIRGGTIVDGSLSEPFIGDVLIEGDKITAIWKAGIPARAPHCPVAPSTVIDATGRLVCPGFIDAHTHSDAYLVIEPDAPSKISQGITTEINGQCGGSVAPRYGEARLSSDWASLLGDKLTWHSLGEYRTVLEDARPAVNTVQFIGHNTLRSSVVGYAGRAATADEQAKMEYLLDEALDEGGWGLTTGLIYQPGKYSTPEEVTRLARVAARRGGIYATHMRSEGDHILEAIDEVIDLARATGIKAEISHLKTSGKNNWDKLTQVLEKIEGAMAEGLLLGSDRYPYCASGTDLDVVFPDWAGEGAAKAEIERLKDPVIRQKIIDEIDAQPRDWSTVMIGGTWHPATKQFSGRLVSDLVGADPRAARTPGDLICHILSLDLCRTGAFFFVMSESNLDKILARPWIVPGSDASLRAPWGPLGLDHPHPRAYATMPEFLRRAKGTGTSVPEAIRRMTALPAERFGIRNRGLIKEGDFADVLVIDEKNFAAHATYSNPHQFTTGVDYAFVNGVLTWHNGALTGSRAGRFLEPSRP